jgi:hypothetical protein
VNGNFINSAGAVVVGGGYWSTGGGLSTTGGFTNTGTVQVQGSQGFSGYEGTLTVGGNFSNSGDLHLFGGANNGTNATGGFVTAASFDNSGTLEIDGGGNNSGNGAGAQLATTGAFTNQAGAIVTVGGSWDNTGGQLTTGGNLTNAGTLQVQGSTGYNGAEGVVQVGGNFANTGTLTLSPGAGGASGGELLVTGAWSNLDNSGNLSGGGTYNIGGLFDYNGPAGVTNIENGINLTVSDGGEIYNTATSTNALAGLAANAGTFEIDNTNETFTPAGGTFTNSGTMTLGGASGETVTINGTFANTGTVNLTGNNVTLNDDFNNSGGTLSFSGNTDIQNVTGNFNNVNGGTVSFTGSNGQINVASGNNFTNDSTSTVTMAGTNDVITTGTFNNAGSVTIGATETIHTTSGGYTQTAGTTQGFGTINAGVPGVNINGGTIIGGTLPGNPGTLNISGNYTQGTNGTFNDLIAGSGAGQFGVLNITGAVTLGSGSGTNLTLTLLNNYDPTNGTSFIIMDYGSLTSGSFNITDPLFGPGDDQKWTLSYGLNDVVLTAAANVSGVVTATWSTVSGNWTTATEWSCTPGPATCVPNNFVGTVYETSLNSPGNTLTLTTNNSETVNTLALQAGTLDIQTGASLNLAAQPNGITDIPAGAGLIVAGSFTAGANSALANLGTSGGGVEGYLELDGQTITDTPGGTPATLNVASTGQLNVYSGSNFTVNGNLTNSGYTQVNGGSTLAVNNLTNSGYLYTGLGTAAGNTLNVAGAFTNNAGAYAYIGWSDISPDVANVASLTNNGFLYIGNDATVNITGGGQGITDAVAGSTLLLYGTLELGGNSAQSGLGSLTSVEGYVEIDNGQTTNDTPNGGTLTISNTGDLRVNYGSTLNLTGNVTNSGYLVTGASGGAGNTLTVTGALTNNGYTYVGFNGVAPDTASVASLTNNGYLWIGPTATVNITGGGPGITDAVAGSTLFLYGTLELGGNPSVSGLGSLTSVEGYVEIDNGQTTNDTPNGGTLTISNTGDLRANYGSTLNVTGNLTNSGYLLTGVSGAAGNTLTVTGALTNNAGAVTWIGYSNTPDTADVNSLTNNGELGIGPSATLNITGGGQGITDAVAGSSLYLEGTFELGGNPSASGIGSLTSVEGYVEIDNAQTTNDTPIGGTLTVSNTGDLRVNNGSTLTVNGNLTNSGYIYTGVGYSTGSTLNVTGTFTNNAGADTYVGWSSLPDHMNVGALANAGYIQVNPTATLNVAGSTDTNSGNLTLVGGTLSSPSTTGNFDNTGTVMSYPGYPSTISIGGTFTNALGANLTLNNSGDVATIATLANGGIVTVASGALLGVGTGTFSGTGYQQLANGTLNEILTSATSFGVLNITGSVSLAGALDITLAAGFNPSGDTFDILNYKGTLTGTFSNGTSFSEDGYNWTLTNNTSLDELLLTAGTIPPLVAATWSTSSGNWTNAAQWTCLPSYSPCMPNNNPVTAFTATLNSPGNTLTLDSTSSPTTIAINSLSLMAGTLDIGTGATLNLVSQPSGITDIPAGAGLIVAGTFEVNGGPTSALANLGSVEGTLTLEGQTLKFVTPGTGTLSNSGTVNLQQTTTLFINGGLTNSGTINLGNGVNDTGSNFLGLTTMLTNTGSIVLNGNGDSVSPFALTNSGTIALNGNNETLAPGNLSNDSPGSITLNGTNESVSVTGTLTNTGSITLNGSGDTLSADLTNSGTIELNNSNQTLTDTGDFDNSGGTLSFTGNTDIANVAGNFNNTNGGTVSLTGSNGQINVTSGTFTNDGTSSVTMTGTNDTISAGTFSNAGSVTIGGTSETIDTTAGNFNNNSGGTVSFTGSNGQINVGGSYAFNNNSGATVSMAGTGDTITTGAFSNAGSVTIGAKETITATGAGGYSQSGGTTTIQGLGALNASTGGVSITGGTLQGFGTITGNVSMGGTIIAGVPGTPGTLTINGAYTQTASGVYNELISSTANGLLNVSGNTTLVSGASLDITLLAGFNPAPGTTYTVLGYGGTEGGTFSITDPTFNGGTEMWGISYGTGSNSDIVLTAESVTVPPTSVTATWTTGATGNGHWTTATEWSCSPGPSTCVPNNGTPANTSYAAVLNFAGNTLTLDGTDSPASITINTLALEAGTLDIGTGATLNLVNQSSGIADIPSGAGLDVAGTFEVNGGPTSALAQLGSVEGTLTLDGQTLTATPGTGTFTVTGSGTVNLQQTTALTISGNLTSSAYIYLGNGASDTGSNSLTVTGTLSNAGFITLYAPGDSVAAANLANTSGDIDLAGDNQTLAVTNGGNLTNGGLIYLGGDKDAVTVPGTLTNTNTLWMNGTNGTVSVTGELANSGTISIAGGNTLTTGSWSNLDSSGNLSGGGTYNIGGLFQYGGPSGITNIENGISLTVSGGGEIYDTATSSNALASLAVNAGNFEIDNTNETFTPAGGTFTNSGTFTLGGTLGETITISGTLANTGTVNLTGNNITLNDDVNNSGAINFSGANITQNVTGNFNNNSPGTVSFTGSSGQIIVGSGNAFNNASGATVTMGGTNDTITAGSFNNAGMVTVGATETITTGAGGYTQTAGTTQGFGTINGNVAIKGGNIIAGTPGNPGFFTITGNYAQLGGTLTAYLEGTTAGTGGYSQLVIGGTATLGGSLDVDLVGGFVPTPGEDFYLLTSVGGDSGSFSLATSEFPALSPGEGWLLDYSPSSCPSGDSGCLELEVVSAPAGTTPPPAVTPEPSTLVLVATGLLGLAAQRRMKRRNAKPRV